MQGNPESKTFCLRKNFACKIWNSNFGIWNTAQGFRNPLAIGMRNPSSRGQESQIQHLESGIHGVEYKIQDYLRFLSMERALTQLNT